MSSGDSHTGFDAGSFTAGALTGAGLLAAAVGGAVSRAAQLNAERWDGWNRNQLVTAVNLSEAVKNDVLRENDELRVENAKLQAAMRRVTMRRVAA